MSKVQYQPHKSKALVNILIALGIIAAGIWEIVDANNFPGGLALFIISALFFVDIVIFSRKVSKKMYRMWQILMIASILLIGILGIAAIFFI